MARVKHSLSAEAQDRKTFTFLVLALLPFAALLMYKLISVDPVLLRVISDATGFLPAVTSSESPLLSKSMDVYCKTAPLFAVITFVFGLKSPRPAGRVSLGKLIKAFFCGVALLFTAAYFFMFSSCDLADSSRVLKLLSRSDYSLTFFYASLYVIFYIFTVALLYLAVSTVKAIKER